VTERAIVDDGALAAQFVDEVKRYEFTSPIPIALRCTPRRGGVVLDAVMYTLDRDTRKATQVMFSREIWIPASARLAIPDLARHEVEGILRQAWEHEFAEWFKLDGSRLVDAHEDETARETSRLLDAARPLGPPGSWR